MHYKNGRLAKNGDKVLNLTTGWAGILHSAVPNQTACNGRLALTTPNDPYVTIGECVHQDDISLSTLVDASNPPPVSNDCVAEGCEKFTAPSQA